MWLFLFKSKFFQCGLQTSDNSGHRHGGAKFCFCSAWCCLCLIQVSASSHLGGHNFLPLTQQTLRARILPAMLSSSVAGGVQLVRVTALAAILFSLTNVWMSGCLSAVSHAFGRSENMKLKDTHEFHQSAEIAISGTLTRLNNNAG